MAEENGLISEIGHFQCSAVLDWFSQNRSRFPDDFRIALNLSPAQIDDQRFVQWLIKRINQSNVPKHQIELELTETALLADHPDTRRNLETLTQTGICIALDDFGTGYSSLSLLKRFAIGRIKIDRSFVAGLPDRSEDVAIVSAVLSLAQALNIPAVAEGVEHPNQWRFLANRHCDEFQGFLLARPMAGDDLIKSLLHDDALAQQINSLHTERSQFEFRHGKAQIQQHPARIQ